MNHKKNREERITKVFLRKLGMNDFILGELKEEEGDCLLVHDDKRIAIEETSLFYTTSEGFSRMQFGRICNRIIDKASELMAENKLGREIEVRVSFTDNSGKINFDKSALIKKSDILPLAQQINELVLEYLPTVGGQAIIDRSDEKVWDRLSPLIDHITIDDVTGKWQGFYSISGGYIVPRLTSEICQAAINEKDFKPSLYKQKFYAYWLLITADTFTFALHYDLDFIHEVEEHIFTSNYDRVFFFDLGMEKLMELKLSAD